MNVRIRTLLKLSLLSSLWLFASITEADNINLNEQRMVTYLTQQQAEQIATLKKLVTISSGTNNVRGVRRVGEKLRPLFKQLGFKVSWATEPAAMHRAGTFIAERAGTKGKRILLLAHLDTVFPTGNTFIYSKDKKNVFGPGVIDDKGGIVTILYALKALNAIHSLDNATIKIVLTGDEEDSGKPTTISRKPLIDAARNMDVALDFEPSVSLNTATIARRGISNWTLTVTGQEAHSATIFQAGVGAGAIYSLAALLNDIRLLLSNEKEITINPGIILGGTQLTYKAPASRGDVFGKENVVAKLAMAKGDFRFLTAQQKQQVEAGMTTLTKKTLPDTQATVTFQDGIPSMPPSADNLRLLEQYSAASQSLGFGKVRALEPGLRGAGDISHIATIVPAKLAGLGPLGDDSHSIKEKIQLDSLLVQTQRAAVFIYRLTQ